MGAIPELHELLLALRTGRFEAQRFRLQVVHDVDGGCGVIVANTCVPVDVAALQIYGSLVDSEFEIGVYFDLCGDFPIGVVRIETQEIFGGPSLS